MSEPVSSPTALPFVEQPTPVGWSGRFPGLGVFFLSLLAAGAVFVLDLVTPRGVSVAALYVIPVIMSQRAASIFYTVVIAVLCAVFATSGIIIAPEIGVAPQIVLADYAIIVTTLAATAVIGIIANRRAAQVRSMSKLLTMCSWTKKVKVQGQWIPIEDYLAKHLGVTITHGMTEESARQFLEKAGIEIGESE